MNNFKIIKTIKKTESSTGLDLLRVEISVGDFDEILQIKVNGSTIGEKTNKSRNNYNFFTIEYNTLVLENVIIENIKDINDFENIVVHLVTLNGKKVVDHDLIIDCIFVSNPIEMFSKKGDKLELVLEISNNDFDYIVNKNKIKKQHKSIFKGYIISETGMVIDNKYFNKHMKFKTSTRANDDYVILKMTINIRDFCIKGFIDDIMYNHIDVSTPEGFRDLAVLEKIKMMIDGKYYT